MLRAKKRGRFGELQQSTHHTLMFTRRCFIKSAAAAGGFVLLPKSPLVGPVLAQTGAVTLDPGTIPKYQLPLVIPPAMPRTAKLRAPGGNKSIDYYEIAVRQFSQQILPPGLPPTTVWGYGSVNHPGTFNYPSFTIEA